MPLRLTLLLAFSFYTFCCVAQDTTTQYAFYPGGADIYLPPAGKTAFQIVMRNNPLEAFAVMPQNLSTQWTINGKETGKQDPKFGRLSLQGLSVNTADYEAPATPPGSEPILITVEFNEKDVDATKGAKTKQILVCRVHILDVPNFFYLSGGNNKPGTTYELKEPLTRKNDMAEVAMFAQGQWTISITGFTKKMKPMSIALSISGNAKGSYPFKINGVSGSAAVPPYTVVSVNGMPEDGSPFQYTSTDCTPHGNPSECHAVSLNGTVTITDLDEKNKIIKGYFSGQVMSPDYQYEFVSGEFRAYMH